jgi:hypothetical protein
VPYRPIAVVWARLELSYILDKLIPCKKRNIFAQEWEFRESTYIPDNRREEKTYKDQMSLERTEPS